MSLVAFVTIYTDTNRASQQINGRKKKKQDKCLLLPLDKIKCKYSCRKHCKVYILLYKFHFEVHLLENRQASMQNAKTAISKQLNPN